MKTVIDLYNRLNSVKNFKEKYPDYDKDDRKIHVLFLSPCLNESGYCRMILPALELNRTTTHRAIISHIQKWDFNKQFDDYDTPIDLRLIEWADYVVLPAMFTEVEYIIKNMRDINNEMEFIMDLEVNYQELPEEHPDFRRIHPEAKAQLLSNLAKVDILSAPNSSILNYYHDLVQASSDEFLLYFECFPNLLSNITFSGIKQLGQSSGDKVRIGLLLDSSQGQDLKTIIQPLTALLEKYRDKVELVIFGWSPKIAAQQDFFKELPVQYERPVLFTHYYERLNELKIDVGLLPLCANEFNLSAKGLNRFLDFSAFMIPTVVSDIIPFKRLIKEGENGFVATNEQEWLEKTEKLVNDSHLRKEVGSNAFKMAWENFSYNAKSIQRLVSIFI